MLEPLERRIDSCQRRTEVARPSRQALRATALYKASSVPPYGTTLELDDHVGARLRGYPLVDKLRTFTELDPETVEVLSL
jgi:hypothetical protein